jgi:3-dehydroquinate dehydratase/shikimate dehydrogenase
MPSVKPKFCVSILPLTENQLIALLLEIKNADLIEIRLDYLSTLNVKLIRQHIKVPIIITVHTTTEGGFLGGTQSELINIYQEAINAGIDYVDVQYQSASVILPKLKFNPKTKLILSCHSDESEIDLLKKIIKEMTAKKADLYKLVFTANNLNDNRKTLYLINYVKQLHISLIIHAQGEEGSLSRILASFLGNVWTYVSLQDGLQTAPGQLNIHRAKDQYYLHEKNQNCHLFGLVGFPVAQSKGWLIFNRLFHLQKFHKHSDNPLFNSIYLNFPAKNISEFWNNWNDIIDGLSITIPHKESILQFVSFKSEEVKLTGVSNTLVKNDDTWKAYNTDFLAIYELLKPFRDQLLDNAILVFGTGSTARNSIAALQRLNLEKIFLAGRNKERGNLLAKMFSVTFLENINDLPSLSAIIQTTPVGMYPNVDETPDCTKLLKKDMVIFDVIYNPAITQFLQYAKEKGCKTISGEEMYFHQAIKQFEIFTGNNISINYFKNVWSDLFTK